MPNTNLWPNGRGILRREYPGFDKGLRSRPTGTLYASKDVCKHSQMEVSQRRRAYARRRKEREGPCCTRPRERLRHFGRCLSGTRHHSQSSTTSCSAPCLARRPRHVGLCSPPSCSVRMLCSRPRGGGVAVVFHGRCSEPTRRCFPPADNPPIRPPGRLGGACRQTSMVVKCRRLRTVACLELSLGLAGIRVSITCSRPGGLVMA